MSKAKTPQDKKYFSLGRDRRNIFGENAKFSRKNIAKGKQRQHMDERRSVAQTLAGLIGNDDEDSATDRELLAKSQVLDSRRRGFKKRPDAPLGQVLARKKAR